VFQDYTIYVPNSFTPDHNGVNEVFKPVMEGFDEDDFTLYIFNRWGDLIFESHDMQVGWDGTFARQDFQVQDGAYTWKIVAGLKDSSDSKIFVGHVVILK
jgi:gliding motility-associated-like protein